MAITPPTGPGAPFQPVGNQTRIQTGPGVGARFYNSRGQEITGENNELVQELGEVANGSSLGELHAEFSALREESHDDSAEVIRRFERLLNENRAERTEHSSLFTEMRDLMKRMVELQDEAARSQPDTGTGGATTGTGPTGGTRGRAQPGAQRHPHYTVSPVLYGAAAGGGGRRGGGRRGGGTGGGGGGGGGHGGGPGGPNPGNPGNWWNRFWASPHSNWRYKHHAPTLMGNVRNTASARINNLHATIQKGVLSVITGEMALKRFNDNWEGYLRLNESGTLEKPQGVLADWMNQMAPGWADALSAMFPMLVTSNSNLYTSLKSLKRSMDEGLTSALLYNGGSMIKLSDDLVDARNKISSDAQFGVNFHSRMSDKGMDDMLLTITDSLHAQGQMAMVNDRDVRYEAARQFKVFATIAANTGITVEELQKMNQKKVQEIDNLVAAGILTEAEGKTAKDVMAAANAMDPSGQLWNTIRESLQYGTANVPVAMGQMSPEKIAVLMQTGGWDAFQRVADLIRSGRRLEDAAGLDALKGAFKGVQTGTMGPALAGDLLRSDPSSLGLLGAMNRVKTMGASKDAEGTGVDEKLSSTGEILRKLESMLSDGGWLDKLLQWFSGFGLVFTAAVGAVGVLGFSLAANTAATIANTAALLGRGVLGGLAGAGAAAAAGGGLASKALTALGFLGRVGLGAAGGYLGYQAGSSIAQSMGGDDTAQVAGGAAGGVAGAAAGVGAAAAGGWALGKVGNWLKGMWPGGGPPPGSTPPPTNSNVPPPTGGAGGGGAFSRLKSWLGFGGQSLASQMNAAGGGGATPTPPPANGPSATAGVKPDPNLRMSQPPAAKPSMWSRFKGGLSGLKGIRPGGGWAGLAITGAIIGGSMLLGGDAKAEAPVGQSVTVPVQGATPPKGPETAPVSAPKVDAPASSWSMMSMLPPWMLSMFTPKQLAEAQSAQHGYMPLATGPKMTTQLDPLINQAASTYGVDPRFVKKIVETESGGRNNLISSAGAMGLMQLMPGTARELGVTNPMDPQQNIMGGTKYLAQMMNRFGGNPRMAAAAYNAGPGTVNKLIKKYGVNWEHYLPGETKGYLQKVFGVGAGQAGAFAGPAKEGGGFWAWLKNNGAYGALGLGAAMGAYSAMRPKTPSLATQMSNITGPANTNTPPAANAPASAAASKLATGAKLGAKLGAGSGAFGAAATLLTAPDDESFGRTASRAVGSFLGGIGGGIAGGVGGTFIAPGAGTTIGGYAGSMAGSYFGDDAGAAIWDFFTTPSVPNVSTPAAKTDGGVVNPTVSGQTKENFSAFEKHHAEMMGVLRDQHFELTMIRAWTEVMAKGSVRPEVKVRTGTLPQEPNYDLGYLNPTKR